MLGGNVWYLAIGFIDSTISPSFLFAKTHLSLYEGGFRRVCGRRAGLVSERFFDKPIGSAGGYGFLKNGVFCQN